jgi:hypothetical protein
MNDPIVTYGLGTLMPNLVAALQTEQGVPINLTGVSSVALRLTDPRDGTVTVKAATVVTATDGVVSVEMTSDLTDTPVEWLARYRVTFASGRTVDVPNAGYLRIRVG